MSIIKSKDYVPYFYRNSRDYQVFLNLIDLIVNVIKILQDAGYSLGSGIRRIAENNLCPLK